MAKNKEPTSKKSEQKSEKTDKSSVVKKKKKTTPETTNSSNTTHKKDKRIDKSKASKKATIPQKGDKKNTTQKKMKAMAKKDSSKGFISIHKEKEDKSRELEVADEMSQKALERGDVPMSVVGHLDEFRSRLIITLSAIIIITLGSFFLSEQILEIINRPFLATGLKLNVFNLTEGFILRLKASLIAAVLISLPLIIYELWKYIQPAINTDDRKFIFGSILGSILLFYLGVAFTYLLTLPFAIKMLISFTPEVMANTIGASKYLNFVLLFSLGMGLTFQLPILVMILSKIGIITPALLIRQRKYAVVLSWIGAAMITPPDVLTQMMLAIPVMLLYEISIIISKIVVKTKKKKDFNSS
ncbi:MAG: twin-arginine translocase subunit TatC [Spirochaetota bacterium]|nr:twin-arginine translocase subunit TatC [Spirochaetota bacterium]